MQISRVQNNYNINNSPNFGMLNIKNIERWESKDLKKFVHNKEVCKFVNLMDKKGINIDAVPPGLYRNIVILSATIGEKYCFYLLELSKLRSFTAKKAMAKFDKQKPKQNKEASSTKASLNVVNELNNSLLKKSDL